MKVGIVVVLTVSVVLLCLVHLQQVETKWVTFTEYFTRFPKYKPELAEIVGAACNQKHKRKDDAGICRPVEEVDQGVENLLEWSAFKRDAQYTTTSKYLARRLPKEPEKRKLWLKQIGIMHLDVDCKNHYRVCNLHFEGVMGLKDIKNRLKLNAVPILLLPEHPKANQSTVISAGDCRSTSSFALKTILPTSSPSVSCAEILTSLPHVSCAGANESIFIYTYTSKK
ncbi:hypothetical protein RN001_003352 [Aquatica leii]|uniref:THAP-type domain-containing protein n=1 Tax=Aquatica leii TaxID=1421715 RepID=A0AAN7PNJ9_9COLE|nr:hypothetical protein RN001_003352 [Aquatica leii]